MKPYTIHIDISRPRDRVVELFENPENLFDWQTGLVDIQQIDGVPGTEGAKSLLIFKNGNQNIELTETITCVELPRRIAGLYQWSGGRNTLVSEFVELSQSTTRYQARCHYQFSSFGMKLMGLVMPGVFRRQHMDFLRNFKSFCETGKSVRG